MSHFFETTIENAGEEIDIQIEFDYQPYEPMTRHYPGCSEVVDFCGFTNNGAEIEIIDDDLLDQLRIQILEHIAEEKEMSQYGYMLDYERI